MGEIIQFLRQVLNERLVGVMHVTVQELCRDKNGHGHECETNVSCVPVQNFWPFIAYSFDWKCFFAMNSWFVRGCGM